MMGLPLDEMRERVTCEELSLWMAYAEHEGPWWAQRADYHAAAVVRSIYAAAGCEPGQLDEYLLRWGDDTASTVNLIPYRDGITALAAMASRASR